MKPLAERMRPQSLEELLGQEHLVGKKGVLSAICARKKFSALLLWGPPGTGKTTLAALLAQCLEAESIAVSAAQAGVAELRAAFEQALAARAAGRRVLLFVDELHRFHKGQQDLLLPYLERGELLFVGATTEHPAFELNRALLSRLMLVRLEPLRDEALAALIERATSRFPAEALPLTSEARALLVARSGGDARRLLNDLEWLWQLGRAAGLQEIDERFAVEKLASPIQPGDKQREWFYDLISALHKSVRGSDPDATLYWLARLLQMGVEPRYVARRLVRIASEDIGLADPRALELAVAAMQAYELLGSPEGELALAEAALYLALAPKSNALYRAWQAAERFVANDRVARRVPLRLCNAPSALHAALGAQQGYRYPHDEPHGYAAGERYFPDDLAPQSWYHPTDRGIELRLRERLAWLRALDAASRQPKKE